MTDCGCAKATRDLEEYLRNEVCKTEHADIREHLEHCPACRDEALVRLKSCHRWTRTLDRERDVIGDVQPRLPASLLHRADANDSADPLSPPAATRRFLTRLLIRSWGGRAPGWNTGTTTGFGRWRGGTARG